MKVFLDAVGCRLNQSELEYFARQFRTAGHGIVPTPDQADLAVINTCTVTNAADSDSRQKIRQASRAGVENIIVTGCWATLNPEGAAVLPGVAHVIPNTGKASLVSELLQLPHELFDLEFVAREPIPGARMRTRAFIKAQDGCDNRCTFCITTIARGPGMSRPTADILADIRAALLGGTREIVITGVHLGSWGIDLTPSRNLHQLVQAILDETDTPRVRLSSLEPWDLDIGFFDLWNDPRLCRHLHLPLQSGCGTTLRRMARKTTPKDYAQLIANARSAIPDIAISTDIIVGFPGESEAEFNDSLSFVKEMNFSSGHVFQFSARPGTAAALMPNQVPHPVRKTRSAQMRTLLADSNADYTSNFVGQKLPVLWESCIELEPHRWDLRGLTDNYLRVSAKSSKSLWNQITPVKLTEVTSTGLQGMICS
jgi:threonylcarbamoyladenosine tRNA methylthiotransferase MtaB